METRSAAIEAARTLRRSAGYAGLGRAEREALDRSLGRLEQVIGTGYDDPYSVPMATPADLRPGFGPAPTPPPLPPPGLQPGQPGQPPRGTLDGFGTRTRDAIEAVAFPTFVSGLIQGTFQAIVDATVQQVREYGRLVASLAQTLDQFTADNVTQNQARDWLVERHGGDLELVLPPAGDTRPPRIRPRKKSEGSTPDWLSRYGLQGQELTAEFVNGPLVEAARRSCGEERMQHLATLVLMGINRIVVQDGTIKAKVQFQARAMEKTRADVGVQAGGAQTGIAGREISMQAQSQTTVTTVQVNAQTEDSLRVDLMGEVSLRFRTETFPVERFADSDALSLINRHSRRESAGTATPGTPPAPATPPRREGT